MPALCARVAVIQGAMSRAWYLVCLVPIVICSVIAVVMFLGVAANIEAMPRFVVPGSNTVELAPGDYIAFGETESKLGGKVYRNESFSVRCTVLDTNNAAVALDPSGRVTTTYSINGYRGSSMFSFTIGAPGMYRWNCVGGSEPAVIAIGSGVGGGIVKAILMLFAGLISGGIFAALLWRRRRQVLRARTS